MINIRIIPAFVLFVFLLANSQVKASEQNPFFQEDIPSVKYLVKDPSLPATSDASGEFSIIVSVPKDHHAYLDSGDKGVFISLSFDFSGVESAGYKVSPISKPDGAYDKEFEARVLRGKGEFKFSIQRLKGREFIIPPIEAKSQICNDITKICFLPRTDNIPFLIKETPLSTPLFSGTPAKTSFKPPKDATPNTTSSLPEGEGFIGKVTTLYNKYSQNFVLAFIFILISGLLAAATPCVYPMIPITSAIIMGRGGSDRQKGVYHSFIYFFGIIFTYMLLGYVAGMTGGAFNAFMQSSFVNLFFAFIFGFFSLAMLGFFEFTIGKDFFSRISSEVGKKGDLTSTFLMGMAAGLIISPCVGPVVFALLLQVTDRIAEVNTAMTQLGGEVSFIKKSIIAAQGGLMMGGFGVGIGVPFLCVGLLSNRMPKAGAWMEYVKYALGLVILYIAWIYYIKGMKTAMLTDRAAYAILAGIVAFFFSVYLGLFSAEKSKIKKRAAFFLLLPAFYFLYDGFSQSRVAIEGKDASQPSAVNAAFTVEGFKIERHENLKWHRNFEEAKKVALKENKPIFIDFFAYWCANCLEFEKLSVKNKKLNQFLDRAVLVKIYDTDPVFKIFQDNPTHRELKMGLPYFVIMKPNGEFFWEGTQYNAVETMGAMIRAAAIAA